MKVTRRAVCSGMIVVPLAIAAGAQAGGATGVGSRVATTVDDVIARIIDVVSRRSGVSREDILSPLRTREAVEARQKGLYLAHKLSGKSLPEIGRRFGGRDHTTVLHAARKWQALSDGNVRVRAELTQLALVAGASPDLAM